ncbi:hypothetical protein HYZ78_02470 [Candidatus Microgenomates bacterium]|nr:hypothetical protein [Candidatus Microgenomates bacterium]
MSTAVAAFDTLLLCVLLAVCTVAGIFIANGVASSVVAWVIGAFAGILIACFLAGLFIRLRHDGSQ